MIRFLLLSFGVFIVELLAYIIVPIAVIFADKQGRLPRWAAWYETHDALGWEGGWYEPAVFAVAKEYGKRIALIYWLYRNKAYTLRDKLRANPLPDTKRYQEGSYLQKPGKYYWKGTVGEWWQLRVGYCFSRFCIFFQAGWKIATYLNPNNDNWVSKADGMFIGVTVRTTKIEG